jgi:superfamily II DNA/RNA helicase
MRFDYKTAANRKPFNLPTFATMRFSELGLTDAILEAIDHMGFEKATPIQEMAIPHILEGRDLIACAQTGTGKTAAFILPILHKISGKEDTSINTLIVVPTRELAMQIDQEIQGLSYFLSVSSLALYGGGSGRDWDEQRAQLTEGVDILVATPGKLISHISQGYVNFSQLKHLVLDEADKMLDMGFSDDILRIIAELPKQRQTLMFSATMPSKIRELAKRIMVDPAEVALSISKPAAGVTQRVALTFDNQKIPMISHLLKEREEYASIIIFTSSKSRVSEIVHALRKSGFKAYGFSSNLEQEQREELLRGFRSRRIRILVATDVMSRGIDIKEINMVINFDTPFDAEDYVHRVGRTARANTKGEAVTLVNEKDMRKMAEIERLIESEVPRIPLPEELGPAPEWVVVSKQRKKRPFHKKRKPVKKGN